jgi:serine phosphatase RsbU (regulator of sigma subunit)
MDVGGDFYDLMPHGDMAAAAIGDVEGHNVAAAALMGQVRTAVRGYSAAGQLPSEVMSNTNRLLVELGNDLLASCVYLQLDPIHQRALLTRAGHPQPLLRRPDDVVELLDLPGGPLLGVDVDSMYRTSDVPLPFGSVLVLYTDGLVESPGRDTDQAVEALADCLRRTSGGPLDELADSLLETCEEPPTDDIALLLLRPVDEPM